MIRRFNFTGRQRITRDMYSFRVQKPSSGHAGGFEAELSELRKLGVPSESRVFVEAYARQSSVRFDFGTVGNLVPPESNLLDEIDEGEVPQFRILVVDVVRTPGRLLAYAEQIRPTEEGEDESRKPLLPLYTRDIGEQMWKVQVDSDAQPALVINSRVPQLRTLLDSDPILRGVIFPAAMREVLRVVLQEDMDAEQDWVRDWRRFAETLVGEELSDGESEDSNASRIEDIVEAFCERETWVALVGSGGEVDETDYE